MPLKGKFHELYRRPPFPSPWLWQELNKTIACWQEDCSFLPEAGHSCQIICLKDSSLQHLFQKSFGSGSRCFPADELWSLSHYRFIPFQFVLLMSWLLYTETRQWLSCHPQMFIWFAVKSCSLTQEQSLMEATCHPANVFLVITDLWCRGIAQNTMIGKILPIRSTVLYVGDCFEDWVSSLEWLSWWKLRYSRLILKTEQCQYSSSATDNAKNCISCFRTALANPGYSRGCLAQSSPKLPSWQLVGKIPSFLPH